MALVGEDDVGGGGQLAPSKFFKMLWFQHKHLVTLAHWIWHSLLSKHFLNLLTPQPQFQISSYRSNGF